ncbi:hypothetical protein K402DRAFT_418678 [Aulographum hederae CBS 113979]|uniref:Meiotic expression up-regulated protein 6 PH domain-containing protein n=1 Tax=Aulographum hederae CBS 113979 TaxID=1176131 RepID=A0A6G1H8L1_9PEZI|nr:hypothetical protein K402DRAFT_418678 [Aulographum hederae CBS 113979]
MSDETKPVETPVAPAVETTPAVDTPAAEPTTTEPVTETAAPAAETTETTPAVAETPAEPAAKAVEPITHGALKYEVAGTGLKSLLPAKKLYFWLGEEAAVPTQDLSHYLRGEKPAVSHPTAAWSSVTGKGLLYYAKHADQKSSPAGVICLADASDISKVGSLDFTMKVHGTKNSFATKTETERDGWVLALEEAAKEAAAKKEETIASPEYKQTMEKLGKPATLAVAAATGAAPKTDSTEAPKEKKSRSVSRGKRASIFGNLLGKKEEEKKEEEKKVEQEEAKPEETPVAATEAVEAPAVTETPAADAPVITEPVTEAAPAEPAAESVTEAAPVTEEAPKAAETEATETAKPKANKRQSIFGNFFEKVRSPTTEKKEPELAPAVPPKDEPVPAPETAEPAAEVPAAEPAAVEAPVEDKPAVPEKAADKAVTPKKEKESFFDKFLHKAEKSKTPTAETSAPAPAVEEPATTEPTAESAVEEAPAATEPVNGVTETPAPATEPVKSDKRRSSFFSNLGTLKKDKKPTAEKPVEKPAEPAAPVTEGETTETTPAEPVKELAKEPKEKSPLPGKLGGLFRNPSKMMRGKKDKEAAPAPAKVEETTEPAKEEAPPAITETEKPTETTEPKLQSIGDVVPDAVSVGSPPAATPTVQATA